MQASTCLQQLGSWFKSQKVCETTFPLPPFPQVYPPRSTHSKLGDFTKSIRSLTITWPVKYYPSTKFHTFHIVTSLPRFGITCLEDKIKAGFHQNLSNVRWLWKVRMCCRLISELNTGPKLCCLSVACIFVVLCLQWVGFRHSIPERREYKNGVETTIYAKTRKHGNS